MTRTITRPIRGISQNFASRHIHTHSDQHIRRFGLARVLPHLSARWAMVTGRADLIGTSAAITRLREEIRFAAKSDAKVLITGESGTGKELVAHLVHATSSRSSRELVSINCAGVPETLLESELFGHERGSFTGAIRDKAGLLEIANQGTAFLDEIGEMSPRMQRVLLRFLESGELQRVGSDRVPARANVRIVAATNRDLQQQIREGTFRLDLYYRLNVLHVHVPPLRERPEDVGLLLRHFLSIYSSHHQQPARALTAPALDALTAYHWPGNVRQLRNIIERIALRGPGPVELDDLPIEVTDDPLTGSPPRASPGATAVDMLFVRMISGESFWSVVYEPFMARDLTRNDVRDVVRRGLGVSRGSYKLLVKLFNMASSDYKPLLNALRKHGCHVAFQPFRTIGTESHPARSCSDTAA